MLNILIYSIIYLLKKEVINVKTDDFDYNLPEELIAQTPLKDRSSSRLLVLDKKSGKYEDHTFKDILNYLNAGDSLVINDTKVIPARLIGAKEDTMAKIEILLLHEIEGDKWECLAKPVKRLHEGTIVTFGDGILKARVDKILEEGIVHITLLYDGILMEILDKLGTMPLPPYIHTKLDDKDRYQTVYAKNLGSAAAPTAGLHFTKELLEEIKKRGINIVRITLHVGLGTFRPVNVEDVTKHKMHTEYYSVSKEAADILNQTRKENHRIIAVGTTSVRTLETVMQKYGEFKETSGNTSIFIYPGYKFLGVDALITNFHLPKSTLIMLVSAFSSKENILRAYNHAVEEKYRFFSFGDAMYIGDIK